MYAHIPSPHRHRDTSPARFSDSDVGFSSRPRVHSTSHPTLSSKTRAYASLSYQYPHMDYEYSYGHLNSNTTTIPNQQKLPTNRPVYKRASLTDSHYCAPVPGAYPVASPAPPPISSQYTSTSTLKKEYALPALMYAPDDMLPTSLKRTKNWIQNQTNMIHDQVNAPPVPKSDILVDISTDQLSPNLDLKSQGSHLPTLTEEDGSKQSRRHSMPPAATNRDNVPEQKVAEKQTHRRRHRRSRRHIIESDSNANAHSSLPTQEKIPVLENLETQNARPKNMGRMNSAATISHSPSKPTRDMDSTPIITPGEFQNATYRQSTHIPDTVPIASNGKRLSLTKMSSFKSTLENVNTVPTHQPGKYSKQQLKDNTPDTTKTIPNKDHIKVRPSGNFRHNSAPLPMPQFSTSKLPTPPAITPEIEKTSEQIWGNADLPRPPILSLHKLSSSSVPVVHSRRASTNMSSNKDLPKTPGNVDVTLSSPTQRVYSTSVAKPIITPTYASGRKHDSGVVPFPKNSKHQSGNTKINTISNINTKSVPEFESSNNGVRSYRLRYSKKPTRYGPSDPNYDDVSSIASSSHPSGAVKIQRGTSQENSSSGGFKFFLRKFTGFLQKGYPGNRLKKKSLQQQAQQISQSTEDDHDTDDDDGISLEDVLALNPRARTNTKYQETHEPDGRVRRRSLDEASTVVSQNRRIEHDPSRLRRTSFQADRSLVDDVIERSSRLSPINVSGEWRTFKNMDQNLNPDIGEVISPGGHQHPVNMDTRQLHPTYSNYVSEKSVYVTHNNSFTTRENVARSRGGSRSNSSSPTKRNLLHGGLVMSYSPLNESPESNDEDDNIRSSSHPSPKALNYTRVEDEHIIGGDNPFVQVQLSKKRDFQTRPFGHFEGLRAKADALASIHHAQRVSLTSPSQPALQNVKVFDVIRNDDSNILTRCRSMSASVHDGASALASAIAFAPTQVQMQMTQTPHHNHQHQQQQQQQHMGTQDGGSNQCHGFNRQTGKRCERMVKTILSNGESVQLPSDMPIYCHNHKKEMLQTLACLIPGSANPVAIVRFNDWINPELADETKILLRLEMEKPISERDEPGIIYAFQLMDNKNSSNDYSLFKIGRSSNPTKRISIISNKCHLIPRLVEQFPDESHSDNSIFMHSISRSGGKNIIDRINSRISDPQPNLNLKCRFSRRIERLIHIELRDRFGAPLETCKCGNIHHEWFKIPRVSKRPQSWLVGEEWIDVRNVIVTWVRFGLDVYQ